MLKLQINKDLKQLKLKLSFYSKLNIVFYTAYIAGPILLIYNNPKIIKEVKIRPNQPI